VKSRNASRIRRSIPGVVVRCSRSMFVEREGIGAELGERIVAIFRSTTRNSLRRPSRRSTHRWRLCRPTITVGSRHGAVRTQQVIDVGRGLPIAPPIAMPYFQENSLDRSSPRGNNAECRRRDSKTYGIRRINGGDDHHLSLALTRFSAAWPSCTLSSPGDRTGDRWWDSQLKVRTRDMITTDPEELRNSAQDRSRRHDEAARASSFKQHFNC